MPFLLVELPNIPEDTARGVRYLYGNGNTYIQLGEQINDILKEFIPSNMEIQDRRSAETNTRYALMTSFQYAEELTDNQMLEAVRSRVDLRYALHLPLDYPHFDPLALCKFRLQLYNDQSDQNTFKALLDKLFVCGFLNACQEPIESALGVLNTICTGTRMEKILEGMHRALETLAATHGDWLRMVALPVWYERYSYKKKTSFWPNGNGEWKTKTIQIGTDIHYLLEQIHKSPQPGIESLREVRNLRKLWEEQYEMTSDEPSPARIIRWRLRGCASCNSIH